MAGVLFGSEIAAQVIYAQLAADPAIQAAMGGRLFGLSVVPARDRLPAMLFYPVASGYTGPTGTGVPAEAETLSIVVQAVCEGTSTAPIRAAAEAQYTALAGNHFELAVDGETYWVDFTEEAEAIPTTEYEGGIYRRALGTRYRVNVTRG